MKKDDEVIAIVIRDAEGFEENAQDGVVNWLDERRPMLQEFDPVNRHTIPMTGDLIEWCKKYLALFINFGLQTVSAAVIFLISWVLTRSYQFVVKLYYMLYEPILGATVKLRRLANLEVALAAYQNPSLDQIGCAFFLV